MPEKPFDKIKEKLRNELPEGLIIKIPEKWEKIGEVGIIKLDDSLLKYSDLIGKTYAKELTCKTILSDVGGISGELRTPNVKVIYGSKQTETIHKENGVKYKLDPQKVMFSSGNMDERIRMATISNKNEIVVDLFAGIGYFTLPIAVHSQPKKIFAIEKNIEAFDYLTKNISLNKINDIVEPILGDNQKTAPKNIADRVLMGYFGGTNSFLQTAIESLKNNIGIIHYHDKFPEKDIPDKPLDFIETIANNYERSVKLLKLKHVKTYAPGISHYVFDIKIGEK